MAIYENLQIRNLTSSLTAFYVSVMLLFSNSNSVSVFHLCMSFVFICISYYTILHHSTYVVGSHALPQMGFVWICLTNCRLATTNNAQNCSAEQFNIIKSDCCPENICGHQPQLHFQSGGFHLHNKMSEQKNSATERLNNLELPMLLPPLLLLRCRSRCLCQRRY